MSKVALKTPVKPEIKGPGDNKRDPSGNRNSRDRSRSHSHSRSDSNSRNKLAGGFTDHRPNNSKEPTESPRNKDSANDNGDKNETKSTEEKKFTGRCRLFVGNLTSDVSEDDFKKMFQAYGEVSEVYLNSNRGFGFIRLDYRQNAEAAKAALDGHQRKGRVLRVRFATHGAALRVKNLHPYVSNELLEQAFTQFGDLERAIVIVDDRGKPTGEGLVEFVRKPGAQQALRRINEGVFLFGSEPKPIEVEPLEQKDDEDGMPEIFLPKNEQYKKEREKDPYFAPHGSFEFEFGMRWKQLGEMEKKKIENVKKEMEEARIKLEDEMQTALYDYQAEQIRQDLLRQQEELRRLEELRNQDRMRRQQELEMRMMSRRAEEERDRQQEERRRQEMMMRQQQEMQRRGGGPMDPGMSRSREDLMGMRGEGSGNFQGGMRDMGMRGGQNQMEGGMRGGRGGAPPMQPPPAPPAGMGLERGQQGSGMDRRAQGMDRGPQGMGMDRGSQGMDRGGPQGMERSGPQGMDRSGPQGMDRGGPQGMDRGGPQGMDRGGPQGMDRGGPQGMDRSGPQGMERGSQGMERGPQGMDRGPQGMDRKPGMEHGSQGMDRGPQGMERGGPQGMDRGPQGMDRGPQGAGLERGPQSGGMDRGPQGSGMERGGQQSGAMERGGQQQGMGRMPQAGGQGQGNFGGQSGMPNTGTSSNPSAGGSPSVNNLGKMAGPGGPGAQMDQESGSQRSGSSPGVDSGGSTPHSTTASSQLEDGQGEWTATDNLHPTVPECLQSPLSPPEDPPVLSLEGGVDLMPGEEGSLEFEKWSSDTEYDDEDAFSGLYGGFCVENGYLLHGSVGERTTGDKLIDSEDIHCVLRSEDGNVCSSDRPLSNGGLGCVEPSPADPSDVGCVESFLTDPRLLPEMLTVEQRDMLGASLDNSVADDYHPSPELSPAEPDSSLTDDPPPSELNRSTTESLNTSHTTSPTSSPLPHRPGAGPSMAAGVPLHQGYPGMGQPCYVRVHPMHVAAAVAAQHGQVAAATHQRNLMAAAAVAQQRAAVVAQQQRMAAAAAHHQRSQAAMMQQHVLRNRYVGAPVVVRPPAFVPVPGIATPVRVRMRLRRSVLMTEEYSVDRP